MDRPRWRFLVTDPMTGAENMALDEALMDRARETGEWTLRVYSWVSPTISFGRNQTARGQYDLARVHEAGLGVVRRPTGGRAILHDREITYSVTAPVASAGDLATSYQRINQLLVHALGALGVAVEIASATARALAPGAAPCFAEPSAGELIAGGRKLAGSAQWRAEGALLQHGSILLADDQTALAALTTGSHRATPAPATLTELLQRPLSIREVAMSLRHAVLALEDPEVEDLSVDDELSVRAAALVVRYLDSRWTWRR